jgi:hypothetical protein
MFEQQRSVAEKAGATLVTLASRASISASVLASRVASSFGSRLADAVIFRWVVS